MGEIIAEAVPLSRLRPAPWNPRTIKDERFKNLVRSVQADPEFLWRRPVLALASGDIYAGNMRYRVAEHLKLPTIPAIVEDIPETLAKERALRDNGQWGDWQEDELAELIYELSVEGSDTSLLGFDEKEVERLMAMVVGGGGGLTDPDAIPEEVEPRTKRGDLWLLGEHRVLCGDSTNAEDVALVMEAVKASCMWTDPPYGVSYVGKTKEALTIENDGEGDLPGLLASAFRWADGVLAPGSPFYVARPAGRQGVEFVNAIVGAGWQFHEELQWVKDSMVLGHSDYHLKHETVVYGWTRGPGRSGRGDHEGSRWYGDHSQVSVFEVDRPKASPDHPTEKPVGLVDAMLRNSSRIGEVVYDPFLGSGTTLIACDQLGRKCYGLEIEPKYVDVIVARWEQFTGKEAVLDGRPSVEVHA